MEPTIVAHCHCELGEGPLWNPFDDCLYWADIAKGRIYRYDPARGEHDLFHEGQGKIGGFTIQADGSLLLFMERGAIQILRDGELITVVEEIPAERDTRFNDVIADPTGRVFCGTMPGESHPATLYRLDLDGSLTPVVENVKLANGMGFTPDGKGFYFTDTAAQKIDLYDYDEETGELLNPRQFVQVPEGDGSPDGLTVDAEGYVWSARYDGSMVVRYAPDGTEERRVQFPTPNCTSLAFGGEGFGDLYVTTAIGEGAPPPDEQAGALFRLKPPVSGKPEFLSRILLVSA
ncbi:MAG TPA: SMP-30/gluconolactonase/LRE family protein [Ardenticatenaceae bacterium]|jgi:D-xylonolactonase